MLTFCDAWKFLDPFKSFAGNNLLWKLKTVHEKNSIAHTTKNSASNNDLIMVLYPA